MLMCRLLSLMVAKQSEDVHEEHDDVHVNVQCSEDVLLGRNGILMISSHHKLCVVDQERREEKGTERTVQNLTEGQKQCQKSEEGQTDARNEQKSSRAR